MSLNVMFHGAPDGDDGPFQLASASGWAAFARWVEGTGKHPLLQELVREGSVDDSQELSRQLRKAMKKRPPSNPDVLDTARGLLEKLGPGHEQESVTVINEEPE